jgi:hypothetical protein
MGNYQISLKLNHFAKTNEDILKLSEAFAHTINREMPLHYAINNLTRFLDFLSKNNLQYLHTSYTFGSIFTSNGSYLMMGNRSLTVNVFPSFRTLKLMKKSYKKEYILMHLSSKKNIFKLLILFASFWFNMKHFIILTAFSVIINASNLRNCKCYTRNTS